MSTFLDLARKVSRDSGMVDGVLPTSVRNQVGILALIVYYVQEAWRDIQNSRDGWFWLRHEFSGTTTAGTARYTASSWSASRWSKWVTMADDGCNDVVTVYKQSEGVANEGPVPFVEWPIYRRLYDRGAPDPGPPVAWSVSPQGEFCLGPVPDAAYVVSGLYRKRPEELANDSDTPELPVQFHDIIAHKAFLLLAEREEGGLHIAVATRRYHELRDALERDQLPRPRIGASALA